MNRDSERIPLRLLRGIFNPTTAVERCVILKEAGNIKREMNLGIVALYNRITGRCRTVAQHRWEWLCAQEGVDSIWVLLDSDSSEIVGHHGLIPVNMEYFGSALVAGKTENTLLDEKYMGTGIYFLHEKRFYQEAKKKFDFLFTNLASGTPAKIRRKLGYRPIGTYANFLKIINLRGWKTLVNYFLERKRSKYLINVMVKPVLITAGLFLSLCFQKKPKIDPQITFHVLKDLTAIEPEFNDFCRRLKGTLGITIHRNSEYLKWRIFDNPHGSHDFLLARNQGEIVGYIITQTLRKPIQQGIVVDLVCLQGNEILFNTILSEAVKRLKDAGVDMLNFPTLDSNNFLNTCIKKNGFIPLHRYRRFLTKNLKGHQENRVLLGCMMNEDFNASKIYQPYYWYYTNLFKEGI